MQMLILINKVKSILHFLVNYLRFFNHFYNKDGQQSSALNNRCFVLG